jgi:CHAT domain-containing protein
LRDRLGERVDVVHFATHALFDPIFPLQSALILTDGQKAMPFTAERLFERPINARLVVLSACETGMGLVIAGDDLLGLTRSFFLGGAESVISSLWPIADEPTKEFMETFHATLRSGDGTYGRAWLAGRDALIRKNYPPSFYAAFVITGAR